MVVLGVHWNQKGVSCSGLLISNFLGYSQMVAAPGVSFYADCWPTLPLGLSARTHPSVWTGSLTNMASGFQERGGAQALPRLLKAWTSPTDVLFVGQAVSETGFQERGSKAPPLGGGGSKDLGATFKNGTLHFLSVKCLP